MEKLNYDTVQKHQSFQTIEEMDLAVRGFLYKHKAELSEGTLAVLHIIWKHSVKVIGVSYARYDYLAEQANLHRRTVIRAVKKLEELGFIKKVPTARMNGKQGVNLLIIQKGESIETLRNKKSPQDVTLPVTPNKTENKQSSLCEKNNLKQYDKWSQEPSLEELDSTYLPGTIHEKFVQATKPFFKAVEIFKLWNTVVNTYTKLDLKWTLDHYIDIVIVDIKKAIFAKKMGRIHTSFGGYFYRALKQSLVEQYRRENVKLYDFIDGF